MIEDLLPLGVHSAEIIGDDPTAYLLPAEQELVVRAVEKRRHEVTCGRTSARRALRQLGMAEAPIGRGKRGQPLWPPGVVGSITHTSGYYAAAVALRETVRSIGIDAEQHDVLPDGVLRHIAFDAELTYLDQLRARNQDISWDRVLFSAKESIYKAWFPLTERWLGFNDVELMIDPTNKDFHAKLLVDGSTVDGPPLLEFSGRFAIRDGLILTAVVLPSSS